MVSVYFVSGRGGSLDRGLGLALQSLGHSFSGRAVSGAFTKFDHAAQIVTIHSDLVGLPSAHKRVVIAHSYGAYLLLHALIEADLTIDCLLLISPVTGSASTNGRFFRPPGTQRFEQAISGQKFCLPDKGMILTGELDWQSLPARCLDVSNVLKIRCSVVPKEGHRLSVDVVRSALVTLFDELHTGR